MMYTIEFLRCPPGQAEMQVIDRVPTFTDHPQAVIHQAGRLLRTVAFREPVENFRIRDNDGKVVFQSIWTTP